MTTNLERRLESGDITYRTTDVIEDWLEYEQRRGLATSSVGTYRRCLGYYVDWITVEGPGTPPRAEDFLTYREHLAKQYSTSTVNLRMSAVRSFYRWLVVTGKIQNSPTSEVRGVRQPNSHVHKRDTLTQSEVKAVFAQCDRSVEGKRDRAILTLMLYCALRAVEVHRANIENLKTQGQRMVLEVWGKGRLEPDEIAVIPRDQEHVIRRWLAVRTKIKTGDTDALFISLSRQSRGRRISGRGVRFIVKNVYARAGVVGTRKTTHSLRHTAITTAIEAGADPLQVQAMARHASFDTTQRYIHEVSRVIDPAEDLISYE